MAYNLEILPPERVSATRPHVADPVPGEPRRSQIIDGLLELCRRGILQGVWVDADVIRVRDAGVVQGLPYRLTWKHAEALIFNSERK